MQGILPRLKIDNYRDSCYHFYMLSTFPALLAYGVIGTTLLRISLGAVFFMLGIRTLTKERATIAHTYTRIKLKPGIAFAILLGACEIILGVLLIIGLYTQIASGLAALASLKIAIFRACKFTFSEQSVGFFIMTAIIASSLVFLGAGIYSFDLPL